MSSGAAKSFNLKRLMYCDLVKGFYEGDAHFFKKIVKKLDFSFQMNKHPYLKNL